VEEGEEGQDRKGEGKGRKEDGEKGRGREGRGGARPPNILALNRA